LATTGERGAARAFVIVETESACSLDTGRAAEPPIQRSTVERIARPSAAWAMQRDTPQAPWCAPEAQRELRSNSSREAGSFKLP